MRQLSLVVSAVVVIVAAACSAPSEDDAAADQGALVTYRSQWKTFDAPGGPQSVANDNPEYACAYDAAGKRVLLHMGASQRADETATTWSWDGKAWRRLPNQGPTPRRHFTFAHDTARKTTVLIGGERAGDLQPLTDVWELTGDQWRKVEPAGDPPWSSARGVYDGLRKAVVVFGGQRNWSWDGEKWTLLTFGLPDTLLDITDADGVATGLFIAGTRFGTATMTDTSFGSSFGAITTLPVRGDKNDRLFYDSHRKEIGVFTDRTLFMNGARDASPIAPMPCMAFDGSRGRLVGWGPGMKVAELAQRGARNKAPIVSMSGPGTLHDEVFPGDKVDVTYTAFDPDDERSTVRFEGVELPAGATVDGHGNFHWQPTRDQVGAQKVVVAAVDPTGKRTRSERIMRVLWPAVPLPQGRVHYDGTGYGRVVITTTHGDREPLEQKDGTGAWSCTVEGENPGKVGVTCTEDQSGDQFSGALDEHGHASLDTQRIPVDISTRDGAVTLHVAATTIVAGYRKTIYMSAIDVPLTSRAATSN